MIPKPQLLFSSTRIAALAAAAVVAGCAGAAPKPSAVSAVEQGQGGEALSPSVSHSRPVAQSIEHFVPAGWVVFAKAVADLDRDGEQDVVALVEHERSGKTVDSYPMPRSRYVMIVVQDAPFPRLVAMNPEILRAKDQFGMYGPTVQLEAAHGAFSITQSGGSSGHRWSYTLDFQYHPERAAWFAASCSVETNSYDVRGRPHSSSGEYSFPYTLRNDFAHYDRGEFDGFCPKL